MMIIWVQVHYLNMIRIYLELINSKEKFFLNASLKMK